jgi:2-phosphosulfolactate phosphatase
MPQRPTVAVHLLPSLIPPGALAGGVAVVIDVLRATSAMLHALAAGCEAAIPCLEVDDARKVAASLPPGTAILGGERGGLRIEGFDLGNSPASYTPEVCRGKTLVITTTNGTRAILASLEAERVHIAAFVNARATLDLLASESDRPLHVVCSGTEGFVSLEDSLMAGLLVSGLRERGVEPANDPALIAAAAWQGTARRMEREPLAKVLAEGRGGHNVLRIGLDPDIGDAAAIDRLNLTAVLRRDPLRIVKHS